MDSRYFDTLAKSLAGAATRRRLVGRLAAVPVLAGLSALLDPDDTEAKERRRRRKQRHKRRTQRRKRARAANCRPQGRATVCAGTCGTVKNRQTCGKRVDCGPCPCEPRAACPSEAACGVYPDGCGGEVRCPAACANPTPACIDNTCQACTSHAQCGKNHLCEEGKCLACDVCLDGSCAFTSVQEAVNATPPLPEVVVCPGTYVGAPGPSAGLSIRRSVTIIGAGPDEDGTILRPRQENQIVLDTSMVSTVHLKGLRITGAQGNNACGAYLGAARVTLTNCAVTENHRDGSSAGGGLEIETDVYFVNTHVTGNSAARGGGIFVWGGSNLFLDADSRVTGNTSLLAPAGIYAFGAVTLASSENVTGNTPGNCSGIFIYDGPDGACKSS